MKAKQAGRGTNGTAFDAPTAEVRAGFRRSKRAFYFRRPGFKRVSLPGLPWSPEFMAAYEQAFAGQPMAIGADRTVPGTLRALAVSYFASPAFRTARLSTQATYRGVIERLCVEHGNKRAALLQREHVVKLIAARRQARRRECAASGASLADAARR